MIKPRHFNKNIGNTVNTTAENDDELINLETKDIAGKIFCKYCLQNKGSGKSKG